jgi:hypothetical protein
MKWISVLSISLLLFAAQAWADEHPPTGDNPPITEDALGGVQAGAIVEWLVLDPPIMTGAGSEVAAAEDSLKDVYPEGEAYVRPLDGDTFESPGPTNKGDTITWRIVNFVDLGADGITDNGAWPASGNCFDWSDWGARDSVNNFTEYAITWAKWDTSAEVTFFLGVDDSGVLYADGEQVIYAPNASQNWGADQHRGTAGVTANQWVHLVLKIGEAAGECGFTLRTDPIAIEVTTEAVGQAVAPQSKLSTVWGYVKTR